ncbi:MAG: hemerythrin domain-containing protein [Chromatiales bacterium]|nr:hemerythrin domain-containing protein [Chromatiales bacterium]
MSKITETMTAEHRQCDASFAQAEECVAADDWDQGGALYTAFMNETEHHFRKEEEVLFPQFEQLMGHAMGPTQVMKAEHAQMRQLFQDMQAAVDERDKDRYLGLSETLMILMQQHNMKEEQILYRMADQALAANADNILQMIDNVE